METVKITDGNAKKLLAEFNKEKIVASNNEFIYLTLISMFDYTSNEEASYNEFFENLEEFLCKDGVCGIFEVDKKVVCSKINFVGKLNEYGKALDCICITKNGKEYSFTDWRNNKDIVVAFNTKNHVTDKKAEVTAELLTEIEVSMKSGTIGTRFNKIISVSNQVEAEKVRKAIEMNQIGLPQVVTSENDIKKILDDKANNTVYDLTSIKDSDKMQYLSKLKDDVLRQFYNIYGLNIQGTSKMAQQTVSEIENGAESSFIIPLSKYYERKTFIEEINKKFNKNFEVKFSKVWEIAFESLIEKTERIKLDNNDNIVNNEAEQEPEKEPEQESEQEPEKEPEKEAEQEPEQEAENEPEKEPEKEQEQEEEKEEEEKENDVK